MRTPIFHIENRSYPISILNGAELELVRRREIRSVYQTNREIKVWSAWFLLKALSPNSSQLKDWNKNKALILAFLQCNENTLRLHLKEMVRLRLAAIDDSYTIRLTSFRLAAEILGIPWAGTTTIFYNPIDKNGKQTFRFYIIAKEVKRRQESQLRALMLHMDHNPILEAEIVPKLLKLGADRERLLVDPQEFQRHLLKLQLNSFRKGSDNLGHIFMHRADINRSVRGIQRHHSFRNPSSVHYLKKRLIATGIIEVQKVRPVVSDKRARVFIPTENGGRKDGYKWLKKTKETALFITDQIVVKSECIPD